VCPRKPGAPQELEALNDAIVGAIEVVAEFGT